MRYNKLQKEILREWRKRDLPYGHPALSGELRKAATPTYIIQPKKKGK